ncbi:MAG: NifB/NifX family molybdenum-iron cluster-binding protein, partial [Theionarchaea archaeon]|nr:NifB/NifX family molybdenum-iron cluster-binding protein [Theionarchaea archaeon]
MKIAIPAMGKTLDSEVDSRFGRCEYFIIVDTNSTEHYAISNS